MLKSEKNVEMLNIKLDICYFCKAGVEEDEKED